jgi:alkyl sulfatase BDS1-like metallo-beta-lactamase superfamily hydrolase
LVRALPPQDYFDYLAIRIVAERAEGRRIALNWKFTDTGEAFLVDLENGALSALEGAARPEADATVTMSRATLARIALQQLGLQESIDRGEILVTGRRPAALGELLGLLETFPTHFNIVEPRTASAASAEQ